MELVTRSLRWIIPGTVSYPRSCRLRSRRDLRRCHVASLPGMRTVRTSHRKYGPLANCDQCQNRAAVLLRAGVISPEDGAAAAAGANRRGPSSCRNNIRMWLPRAAPRNRLAPEAGQTTIRETSRNIDAQPDHPHRRATPLAPPIPPARRHIEPREECSCLFPPRRLACGRCHFPRALASDFRGRVDDQSHCPHRMSEPS